MRYPAQENPLDPVPQLEEDEEPPDEPEEENSEIFLRVDVPAQCGHGGSSEAWAKLILFSNSCPQSGQ
jgi:hypothetical protein